MPWSAVQRGDRQVQWADQVVPLPFPLLSAQTGPDDTLWVSGHGWLWVGQGHPQSLKIPDIPVRTAWHRVPVGWRVGLEQHEGVSFVVITNPLFNHTRGAVDVYQWTSPPREAVSFRPFAPSALRHKERRVGQPLQALGSHMFKSPSS